MKNIFKILMVFLLPLLLINSCREDADRNWTTPDAAITLYNTTLSSNTLYPSMADNSFRLTWDAPATATGSYDIQFSKTADFKTPIKLATSAKNTYTTTISALNTALLQAGYSPYSQTSMFIRVVSGTSVSNVITLGVTPYPVAMPVITNPTAGQSIVLDGSKPSDVATTVKWTDYSYGVDVEYNVEIAPKGSTTFVSAGTIKNAKELAWSNFTLNDAAIKLGLPVNVASNIDVRVTATTKSAGGTIMKTSPIVTFSVTPYQPAYVKFYIVGGGSAVGWDASNAQMLKNSDQISEIYTYLQNNGEFRFLGQQDWNPINYSLNASGIKDSYKYFNSWSSNLQTSGDENMKFTGNSGMYKITIDQNKRSIDITPSSLPTVPSSLYLVGSLQGWNANGALEMTQTGDGVFEYSIKIPDNAEFKFIGQQSWGDLEWANIHTGGNSGFIGPKGDNDNIKYSGGDKIYKITANIKLGTYKITPQ